MWIWTLSSLRWKAAYHPADGHHRRPHASGVLRHLPDGLGEVAHLAPGAPQTVLTVQLYAGAVGHVVQVVLHPAHGLREVLLHLANEGVCVPLRGCIAVVLVLQQLVRAVEVPQQTLYISLLLFCCRLFTVLRCRLTRLGAFLEMLGGAENE